MRTSAILLLACFVVGCGQKSPKPVSFRDDIQPILANRCVKCHGTGIAEGNIVLTAYETLMASRTISGKKPLVISEKPGESWLYILSATNQPHFRMPPDTTNLTPLPQQELELISRWITQGAKDN